VPVEVAAPAVAAAAIEAEGDQVDQVAAFGALLREITPKVRVMPALVAINALVFALMVAMGVGVLAPSAADVLRWGANYGPLTAGGQPWRILTSAFLHFGLLHVGLNMMALVNAGAMIERMFGPRRFLVLYLVSALTGSTLSLLINPQVVSAGASGAVFGVYGALGGFLLRQRGAIPPPVLKKLTNVALGFIGYNLFAGFTHAGIDNSAHIGGLLGGLLCGYVLARPLVPPAQPPPAPDRRPAALLAGAAMCALGVALLMPVPPDPMGKLNAFFETESRAIDHYNKLVEQAKAGQVSDTDYADQLEQVILPPWRQAQANLAPDPRWPAEQRDLAGRIALYAAARERGWTAFARALRAHDDEAARQAQTFQHDADQMLKQLNKP